MKKDYTLKLVLAMLVVVLVSLVSFVGVYRGRNLLKEYSLGKDFSKRKIATFSVVEDKNENQQSEESAENQEGNQEQKQPLSEKDIIKNYNTSKNNIAKRLISMKSEEFDIRLDEATGKLVIEVPESMDSNFISSIVSKGKVEIKNASTNEVIADGNVFKDASAALRDETFSVGMQQVTQKIVVLDMKLTKDAKKKITEANPNYTDADGKEAEAKFAIVLDGSQLYSEEASSFISTVEKNGKFVLYMGQNDKGEELEKDYQQALAITAMIKCGEIPVQYEIDTIELMSSSINVKAIAIVAGCILTTSGMGIALTAGVFGWYAFLNRQRIDKKIVNILRLIPVLMIGLLILSRTSFFQTALQASKKARLVQDGDIAILTAGVPLGISGTTNVIREMTVH